MYEPMNSKLMKARTVLPSEYEPISSSYLSADRRHESWHIQHIEWDGEVLRASARIEGAKGSATDGRRYHLSVYSAREMDAQFAIIGMHLKLGLTRKTSEVWLLRCEEICTAAITDPDDVRFEMSFQLRLSSRGKILCERKCRITDAHQGLIQLNVLALMPWDSSMGPLPDLGEL
jgi:hypothetical protein